MKTRVKVKELKDSIDLKKIIIFFAITIIFFGMLINMEYATDTYSVFTIGARKNIIHFLGTGRFVTAIIIVIVRLLNLKESCIYFLSFVMACICLIASLYELEKIIYKDVKKNVISIILSTLIILNAFIIELFMFIEKGILIASILFIILAIKHLIKYFENKDKKEILKTLVWMLLANGSYQGTVALFIAIATVYVLKYSKNIKAFVLNNVVLGICYAIPAIIDLIIGKIFAGERISGKIILSESIQKVMQGTKSMMYSYNMLPKYIFLVFLGLAIGFVVFEIIKNKSSVNTKVIQILSVIYIILGTLVATILPQLMQNTESIWMVARSTYAFSSLIGIVLLYTFINFNVKKAEYVIVLMSICYLCVQYKSFTEIEISRYKLNYIDKEETLNILNYIEEYENETGNKIENIVVYQDKYVTYTYKDLFVTGDLNVRAYSSDWATKGILEYYSGRKFENVEKKKELEERFEKEDWKSFSKEQLVFENNTLHICCY